MFFPSKLSSILDVISFPIPDSGTILGANVESVRFADAYLCKYHKLTAKSHNIRDWVREDGGGSTNIMCNCVHVELLIDYSLSKPYCTFLISCNLALSEAKTTFLKNL